MSASASERAPNGRARTSDVIDDQALGFEALLLKPEILKGIQSAGFKRPSPIQWRTIPAGRFGSDLIAHPAANTRNLHDLDARRLPAHPPRPSVRQSDPRGRPDQP